MKKIRLRLLTVMCLAGSVLIITSCNRNPEPQKSPSTQKTPETSSQKGSADQNHIGKYIDETNPQNFTELKSDNTYILHRGDTSSSGMYTIVDGKRLVFYLSSGETVEGTIDDKSIIGKNGGRSTRQ
ncbi:MAG: hypothetical protein HGB35_02210 [Geobacteraceae bacterium]|nr:hypothetical protein [Geobacteraceae bacterium]